MWTKKPNEIRFEQADWSALLNGDTVSGVPTFELMGNLTCTVTHLGITGSISTIRISGGVAGESGFIKATVLTTSGQRFETQQGLKIVSLKSVVS